MEKGKYNVYNLKIIKLYEVFILNKHTDNKITNKMSMIIIAIILAVAVVGAIIYYAYQETRRYVTASENKYNMAFFELVDYVQNVETYLAKSLISTTPEHGAETLTNVWREASVAQSCLAQLPINSHELENTSKFLNQVSDYSYSLSRKNIAGESLSEEDFDNIRQLHTYSLELENTLNQLSEDLNNGRIKWGELQNEGTKAFATQVSTISQDSFSSLEENFHEYAGLIYDGAFSEHITSAEKKGLTGEDIDEEKAKEVVKKFYGEDKIESINSNGFSENAEIPSFDFSVKMKESDNLATISISKKGGHVIFANYNKQVNAEIISQERADEIGKEFLNNHGYTDMKETYYLKQNGIVTINYAFTQNNKNNEQVVIYPDLIKVKIALDDGSVLGIETSGYLNSHTTREFSDNIISKEKAKEVLNKELQIESENLAMIPTKWNTEVYCWEFKGKVEDNEFLVYINAETGKEEDILIIVNTPDGTLTH